MDAGARGYRQKVHGALRGAPGLPHGQGGALPVPQRLPAARPGVARDRRAAFAGHGRVADGRRQGTHGPVAGGDGRPRLGGEPGKDADDDHGRCAPGGPGHSVPAAQVPLGVLPQRVGDAEEQQQARARVPRDVQTRLRLLRRVQADGGVQAADGHDPQAPARYRQVPAADQEGGTSDEKGGVVSDSCVSVSPTEPPNRPRLCLRTPTTHTHTDKCYHTHAL